MARKRTTEDLRDILFEAIDDVKNNRMSSTDAKAITSLADKIIGTAKLEMEFSKTCSKLDKEDQGVDVGPVLLTSEKS